jgi:hypothetical protein
MNYLTTLSNLCFAIIRGRQQNGGNVDDISKSIINDNRWLQLNDMIDENVLTTSHQNGLKMSEIFKKNEFSFTTKPQKKMERILTKRNDNRIDNAFKLNSDLIAFHFHCNVKNIYHITEKIQLLVETLGGVSFVRNQIRDSNGKYNDIVLYLFAYVPDIGLMEIHIGDPFTSLVFANDSKIRDMKIKGEDTSNMVDLWDNVYGHTIDSYTRIKNYILAEANL